MDINKRISQFYVVSKNIKMYRDFRNKSQVGRHFGYEYHTSDVIFLNLGKHKGMSPLSFKHIVNETLKVARNFNYQPHNKCFKVIILRSRPL